MNTQPTPSATNSTTAISGRRRKMALAAGLSVGTIGVVAGGFGGSASAIIDGADTTASANPWQVALTSPDGEQFCGGSVVSERVIVTAAHCTQGIPEGEIVVRAGATDLASNQGQIRNVTAVIEHPKYVNEVGDIAMLVLDTPLDLSNTVQPIQLATAADVDAASTARVTGWGVTDENADDTPTVLQGTDVPLISDADCSLVDAGNDDELCAGGTGTDSCYGDSGGPLTIATENGQALAGVVSWGEQCGDDLGGVYAEVPTFATWVAERVADPDAPAGDRLPTSDEGFNEIDFDDSDASDFEDSDFDDGDFGDAEYVEFDQEFIDELGDEFETLPDDEFWDRYDEYTERNDTEDNNVIDAQDTNVESDTDIDAMTDAEFQDYVDSLSDAEFDELLQEWNVAEDAGDWDDQDWDDQDWDDQDWDDAAFDDMWDDESYDDESYGDWVEYDLNDDGIVQWNEFAEL